MDDLPSKPSTEVEHIEGNEKTYANDLLIAASVTLPVFDDLGRMGHAGQIICGLPGGGHGPMNIRIAKAEGDWGGWSKMYTGEIIPLDKYSIYAIQIDALPLPYGTDTYYRVSVL